MVVDPNNGEVLALVSKPDFDPHHPGAAKPEQLFNMAKIETFLLKNLGIFIEKLAGTKDPEGSGSMLDNTMVLFGSGMSSSSKHLTVPPKKPLRKPSPSL